MTKPREWPNSAKQVRDDTADCVISASRKIARFIHKNNNNDPDLISAMFDLQQAQTLLLSMGAPIKPEKFL